MEQTSKGTVLVIEDNLLNLDMACELLETAGFRTLRAEDALTGIQLAKRDRPDIILIDLHLPTVDGFLATGMIKNDPELQSIPVIAFTAMVMKGDREKALLVGCRGYISKPIDVKHFAETVEFYLNASREKGGPAKPPSNTKSSHDDGSPRPPAKPELPSIPPMKTHYGGATKSWGTPPSSELSKEFPGGPSHSSGHVSSGTLRPPDPATSSTMLDASLNLSSHKVLVVDDNPMNVELLRGALESMRQEVVAAYSGLDAIKLARQIMPDLILLDIMMPDMDGYDVLDQLKRDPATSEIPVIFVSALDKTKDIVRGFRQGTYDYITKPFKTEELKARVFSSLKMKDLQDSLKSERDKLSRIFHFSADGIALLDNNFSVVSANPEFAKWFKLALPPDGPTQLPSEPPINFFELIGCQCQYGNLCPLHNRVSPTNGVEVDHFSHNGTSGESPPPSIAAFENATIVTPAGETRHLHIRGAMIPRSGQNPGGYVMVVRDVTEEKLMEQRKETFVATLTHDLKTPIRAEHRALELLKGGSFGPLSSDQQEVLGEILHSNRFMHKMVDSLLTTYKYEDGRMELKLEWTDLNQLIKTTVAGYLSTLASEKRQNINLELAEGLPDVRVDPIEIQRVLNNLVQNAITYTPPEGLITVITQPGEPGRDEVVVTVKDTGRGIEQEYLEWIFNRFSSMAKKFRQVGTGLGLYLSKQILEAHQGRIGVRSKLGEGSEFYFHLPVNGPVVKEKAEGMAIAGSKQPQVVH